MIKKLVECCIFQNSLIYDVRSCDPIMIYAMALGHRRLGLMLTKYSVIYEVFFVVDYKYHFLSLFSSNSFCIFLIVVNYHLVQISKFYYFILLFFLFLHLFLPILCKINRY